MICHPEARERITANASSFFMFTCRTPGPRTDQVSYISEYLISSDGIFCDNAAAASCNLFVQSETLCLSLTSRSVNVLFFPGRRMTPGRSRQGGVCSCRRSY
jgi:hypothetical protein